MQNAFRKSAVTRGGKKTPTAQVLRVVSTVQRAHILRYAEQILNKYFLFGFSPLYFICLFYAVIYWRRAKKRIHAHRQDLHPSTSPFRSLFSFPTSTRARQERGIGPRFSAAEISITTHSRRQITREGTLGAAVGRGWSGDEKSAGVRAERIYRFAGPVIRYSRTNVRDIN